MGLAQFDFVFQFSWMSAWFWVLLLIGLVWLRRHLALNRAHEHPELSTADARRDPDVAWPTLTVLVAGKEEEANIERCLRGLLAQDYPNLRVVAINDRSDDRTGQIMDAVAAEDERLTVVHVQELPAGWAGKNHAMHLGVQEATGEYLLFTDADCRFPEPLLLKAAMGVGQKEQADLLSVLPELEAHTFWERVVQPPAGAIMVFWFPPEKVNNAAKPHAYANGAFMLMPRATYGRLGGHEAVRAALNEDMHMARRVKALGLRLRVLGGGGLYSVRMYTGLRQIWNGWTRIFYACFGTWLRLIVSAIFLSVFSLFPVVSLLISPLLGQYGVGIAFASGLTFISQQSVLWRFYALCRMPPAWALTYPLGAGLCFAMTINAMRRLLGARTQWRGTSYAGGA